MIRRLKVMSFALTGILMLCLCMGINSYAKGDDNIGFSFDIKPYYRNTRVNDSQARYRQTTDPNNMWKVGLRTSTEYGGKGTITNFWLEDYNETNVSDDISAVQGSKVYYKVAYNKAAKKNVYLTAENNGYDSVTYHVTGVWDEETGKYAG